MRRGLVLSMILATVSSLAIGCASQAPMVADQGLWNPPGQGELEVKDNHSEPGPKPKPRARSLQSPNQSTASSDNVGAKKSIR